MDVRYSNVVEVTRQYFQGVPPGVGSGPQPGQAPAQRPPNYWTSGASQAVYPPVSSAPSPLPYPNQQQQQRLPSIGAFTSGQQRSSSTLPSMSQIKQGLSVQEYASGYSGRISSGFKYSSDQQQAGAALYNPAVSPSMQAVHRQSASPRTQTSHQSLSSSKVGTPSSNSQASVQAHGYQHSQQQGSSQASYHIPSSHLTPHQLLTEAAQQLSLLQASQSNQHSHLSSGSQSQNSHPRQSPIVHSSHQFFNASQQLLNSHSHQPNTSNQELRGSHQTNQHHSSNRHQSSVVHSQQPPGSTHHQIHQQISSHLQQQVSHRQQSTSQSSSSHRLPSPAAGHSVHLLPNSHHSQSQISQQLSHHHSHQSSSHSHKTSSHQPSYSQTSAQQLSHHLLNQLQPMHQSSASQQSQTNLQASYHQQPHHVASTNVAASIANHRLPSPSSHHQSNIVSGPGQSQTHYGSMQQQHRSSHSSHSSFNHSASSHQTPYMSSSSSHSSLSQNQLINATSRTLGQLSANNSITNLTGISHSMTHARETHSVSGHLNISNLGSSPISARESSHAANHINLANIVNNASRENVISSLPSIANLMTSQLPQFNTSRSSALSQTSSLKPRKTSQSSIVGGNSSANIANESSSILNLSDVQGRSVVNLSSSSHSHSGNNLSSNLSQRSITSGVIKRESPLDLSVKTVRQSADSTAADEEYLNLIYSRNPDYFQSKTPPKSSPFPPNSSPFEASRSNNKPVSAPKVDFTPDFSSTAHIIPKKKKAIEAQQYANSLPSIGSFAKPQLPRSRADPYSYYQSGPSTSNIASLTQNQQVITELQKGSANFPTALKRSGDNPNSAVPPPKIPRTDDTWRQTIDRQIENKLNSYLSSKTVNGDRPFEPPQNFRYPQCPQYSPKPIDKPVVNGQANKQVLNILRTSLETREARNKAIPASSPTTDRPIPKVPVLPPPAPSPVRQNLPPFGAIGTYPKEMPPIETKPVEIVDITDDNDNTEAKKLNTNGNASNGELDGLAAFLAARIRTKAELKQQVDPGGPNRFGSPTPLPAAPSFNQIISTPNRVLKTEAETETSPSQVSKTQQAATISPPKLTKEHGTTINIPRKRDSDSDCEAPPVLERQRKSSTHQPPPQVITHVPITYTTLPEPPPPPVVKEEDLPEEEKEWLKRCDQLIDQLMIYPSGAPKKKKFKRKRLKIKPIPKEEPRESIDVQIKSEPKSPIENRLLVKQEPQDELEENERDISRRNAGTPLEIAQETESSQSEFEEAEVAWQRRSNTLVRRKKPLGDGSHFVPGWQNEVYRYKQSLRMPDSLISIARPTSSLPDLQNYMDSPAGDTTPESTPAKQDQSDNLAVSLNKEKTILDKLMERFKLNRTEPEAHDAKNPYMDYLNKERRKVRGRSHSRKFIKKKATFKEIFGEERPASAPPAGVREGDRKKSSPRHTKVILRSMLKLRSKRNLRDRQPAAYVKPKKRRGPKPKGLDRQLQQSGLLPPQSDKVSEIKRTKTIKRKGKSSGFDYIKKKKKINKDHNQPGERKRKKKKCVPMTEDEIKEELKAWVLNKDLGETNLQRAARLGYTEVVLYCLSKLKEKATCQDYAGFTPLHEAASQGHIDIAKLLLDYGANVNEPAQGGVRPLHEAAENGFTDLMEVLLRFGADPELATCNGQTAFSLATDERARSIIEQYRIHLEEPPPPSNVPTTAITCQENLLDINDDDDTITGFEIEESDIILPSLYRLNGEPRSSSWILFHELAPLVRAKTKDSLLRRLGATRQDVRDLRPTDFYSRARTRTLTMGDTERKPAKLGTKMSRVTLFRYTPAVRLLLDVETTVIPR